MQPSHRIANRFVNKEIWCQYKWRSQNAEKYVFQRETTGTSSDSLQLRPFSKRGLLLGKEFAHRGRIFIPLRAVPYGMESHFYHIR